MFYNDTEGKVRYAAETIINKYYGIIQISYDSEARIMSRRKLKPRLKALALAEIDATLNTDMSDGRELLTQVRDYISNY